MQSTSDLSTIDPPTNAPVAPPAKSATERLECLDVWGGNQAVQNSLSTTGLDLHCLSRPYGHGDHGGDVFYVSSCSSGRITRVMLADVMGHGHTAAGTAAGLRDLMHRLVDTYSQKKLVRSLNQEFSRLRSDGSFASAVVLSYFRPTKTISICNAGHPPPLLYREATNNWELLDPRRPAELTGTRRLRPRNLPLGMMDGVDYEIFDVDLGEHDRVLLYTDGLIEAMDASEEQIDVAGLLDIVRSRDQETQQLPRAILDEVLARTDSTTLADDASVLLIESNDLKSSLRDQALAPFRFLGRQLKRQTRHPSLAAVDLP